ncbi:MAG: hypothetical protein ABIN67_23550 [Ferruginibacter sp.]
MAQKKQQQLSPENYIRQRSRNLPIDRCLVNKNWQDGGMAEVFISRKHVNGNRTFCLYIVDLYCLGIKDTTFRFNQDEADFDNFLEAMSENIMMEETSYTLAHNIVFAGLEFAEEFGFKPHKDFIQTTQYFLEEDTDAIELIDIECGHDGKPFYVQGPYDTPARANQIMSQLQKAVGPDGYEVLREADMVDDDDDDDDDDYYDEDGEDGEDDDGYISPYEGMSFEEQKQLFLAINPDFEQLDLAALKKLEDITNAIYNTLVPREAIDAFEEEWVAELDVDIADDFYTPGMLGLEENETITEKAAELLSAIILNKENLQDALKELKKEWGDFAFADYASLKYFTTEDSESYKEKLAGGQKLYPHYALFTIEKYGYDLRHYPERVTEIKFETVFSNRAEITGYELFNFQTYKLNYFILQKDMAAIEAMFYLADYFIGWDDEYIMVHRMNVLLARVDLLRAHFSK